MDERRAERIQRVQRAYRLEAGSPRTLREKVRDFLFADVIFVPSAEGSRYAFSDMPNPGFTEPDTGANDTQTELLDDRPATFSTNVDLDIS